MLFVKGSPYPVPTSNGWPSHQQLPGVGSKGTDLPRGALRLIQPLSPQPHHTSEGVVTLFCCRYNDPCCPDTVHASDTPCESDLRDTTPIKTLFHRDKNDSPCWCCWRGPRWCLLAPKAMCTPVPLCPSSEQPPRRAWERSGRCVVSATEAWLGTCFDRRWLLCGGVLMSSDGPVCQETQDVKFTHPHPPLPPSAEPHAFSFTQGLLAA